MYDALIHTAAKTAWLVTTGTMTNAALLFAVHPNLVEHIRGLSLMGGGIGNFFTHAHMGRYSEPGRIKISPRVWREYPEGAPDVSPPELVRLFKEKALMLDVDEVNDEKLAVMLDKQRKVSGNWTPRAEFNVGLPIHL